MSFVKWPSLLCMQKTVFLICAICFTASTWYYYSINSKQRFPLNAPSRFVPFNRTIVILLWTTFYGDITWQNKLGFQVLSDHKKCEFISNKSLLTYADYVFFHNSSFTDFPPARSSYHRWVYFNLEPPVSLAKWWLNATFNFSSTYSPKSNLPQPYGKCEKFFNGMNDGVNHISDVIRRKSFLVAWFVTNCDTQSQRLQYVDELKKYIQVDVFGRCGYLDCPKSYGNCEQIISQKYKFYLSFENTLCKDYVTEKVFRPMISNYPMVPIVMGYANYSEILPTHSFIDVRWFKSPENLAHYLHHLDKNNIAYAKYFAWRRKYRCGYFTLNFTSFCEKAHQLYDLYRPRGQSIKKFSFNYECISPQNFFQNNTSPSWIRKYQKQNQRRVQGMSRVEIKLPLVM